MLNMFTYVQISDFINGGSTFTNIKFNGNAHKLEIKAYSIFAPLNSVGFHGI